jgi:hypothetical protein
LSHTLVGCSSGGSTAAGGGSGSAGSCTATGSGGEASTHSRNSSAVGFTSASYTTPPPKTTDRYSKNAETSFGLHSAEATSGNVSHTGSNIDIESIKSPTVQNYTTSTRATLLPWSAQNRSSIAATNAGSIEMLGLADNSMRPGELVMRSLFADFVQQAEKKIESVMLESHVSI